MSSTGAFRPTKPVAHKSVEENKSIEETLLESTSISRAASLQGSSNSVRQAESVESNKISSKIIAFLSFKMNAVSPLLNQMDLKELEDYEQFAALSAGGIPNNDDTVREEALESDLMVKEEDIVERDVEGGDKTEEDERNENEQY